MKAQRCLFIVYTHACRNEHSFTPGCCNCNTDTFWLKRAQKYTTGCIRLILATENENPDSTRNHFSLSMALRNHWWNAFPDPYIQAVPRILCLWPWMGWHARLPWECCRGPLPLLPLVKEWMPYPVYSRVALAGLTFCIMLCIIANWRHFNLKWIFSKCPSHYSNYGWLYEQISPAHYFIFR